MGTIHVARRRRRRLVAVIAGMTATIGLAAAPADAAPIANTCAYEIPLAQQGGRYVNTYTVQPGDTLYRIVRDVRKAHGDAMYIPTAHLVRRLRAYNAIKLRRTRGVLRPGMVLGLPQGMEYCIRG